MQNYAFFKWRKLPGMWKGKKEKEERIKEYRVKEYYIYMHVWKRHNKPLHFVMLMFTNKAILKDTLWKIWQKESSVRWSHLTFKMRSRNIVSLIASFLLSKTSIPFRNPYGSNYKKKVWTFASSVLIVCSKITKVYFELVWFILKVKKKTHRRWKILMT